MTGIAGTIKVGVSPLEMLPGKRWCILTRELTGRAAIMNNIEISTEAIVSKGG
jgi:hypothetical protein